MAIVTFYERVFKKNGIDVDLNNILKQIKNGKWKDKVDAIQSIDPEEKDQIRDTKAEELPALTVSGTFDGGHSESNIIDHSGFIALDIDNVPNIDQAFKIISQDKYTYCAFRSVSGRGICVIIKIQGSKHRKAWAGLERYYLKNYEIGIDPSGKDKSRLRFISYDPDLYFNSDSDTFKNYVKKKKGRKPAIPNNYFTSDEDFNYVLQQIHSRKIDLTADYNDWVRLAFALKSEFGEKGRDYFHQISQYYSDYSERRTNAKYDSADAQGATGIGTFYYLADKAGLDIKTQETRTILRVANYAKKRGDTNLDEVCKQLDSVDNIPEDRAKEQVKAVMDSAEDPVDDDEDVISQIIDFLRHNYKITYNEISMKYYMNQTQVIEERDWNDMYISTKQAIPKANKNDVFDVVKSSTTKSVNPVLDFFERNSCRNKGAIKQFADAIDSPTGMAGDNFMPNYVEHFIRKWMVGAVATWIGKEASPLMLILAGGQSTGKTHSLRYILPNELQRNFYAEQVIKGDNDFKILMTTKIMILDDELSGHSKSDIETIKNLCSKRWINVRRPYGKHNEDLKRRAVFAGTSNNLEIINDPTGNRRFIPIEVMSIDHQKYNDIDKKDLWMEAYSHYKDGFEWKLSKEDVKQLNDNTQEFEEPSPERELLMKYFEKPKANQLSDDLTNTEIKAEIERKSDQRLSARKLGMELKSLGYEKKVKKVDGKPKRIYEICTL